MAPLLHTLPLRALEVKKRLSPSQMIGNTFVEIVGVEGMGFTVTTTGNDEIEVQPFAPVLATVKVPPVFTIMFWVLAPLLQVLPKPELDLNVTLSP